MKRQSTGAVPATKASVFSDIKTGPLAKRDSPT